MVAERVAVDAATEAHDQAQPRRVTGVVSQTMTMTRAQRREDMSFEYTRRELTMMDTLIAQIRHAWRLLVR
jgi:hypothetical protein